MNSKKSLNTYIAFLDAVRVLVSGFCGLGLFFAIFGVLDAVSTAVGGSLFFVMAGIAAWISRKLLSRKKWLFSVLTTLGLSWFFITVAIALSVSSQSLLWRDLIAIP